MGPKYYVLEPPTVSHRKYARIRSDVIASTSRYFTSYETFSVSTIEIEIGKTQTASGQNCDRCKRPLFPDHEDFAYKRICSDIPFHRLCIEGQQMARCPSCGLCGILSELTMLWVPVARPKPDVEFGRTACKEVEDRHGQVNIALPVFCVECFVIPICNNR